MAFYFDRPGDADLFARVLPTLTKHRSERAKALLGMKSSFGQQETGLFRGFLALGHQAHLATLYGGPFVTDLRLPEMHPDELKKPVDVTASGPPSEKSMAFFKAQRALQDVWINTTALDHVTDGLLVFPAEDTLTTLITDNLLCPDVEPSLEPGLFNTTLRTAGLIFENPQTGAGEEEFADLSRAIGEAASGRDLLWLIGGHPSKEVRKWLISAVVEHSSRHEEIMVSVAMTVSARLLMSLSVQRAPSLDLNHRWWDFTPFLKGEEVLSPERAGKPFSVRDYAELLGDLCELPCVSSSRRGPFFGSVLAASRRATM